MPDTVTYNLTWDGTGQRKYENGVNHGVLYVQSNGAYPKGVAWNGLTAVTESPDGAEPTDLYADNIKYASMRSAETFGGTIEAYTYPDEWMECDGSAELSDGIVIGQQARKVFGLCYRTEIGTDADPEAGYKLHLVYGATASPSERAYETINDSPDAITFSWEFESTPVNVTGHKATALLTIDSTKLTAGKMTAIESVLYGTAASDNVEAVDPRLPLPDEVASIIAAAT